MAGEHEIEQGHGELPLQEQQNVGPEVEVEAAAGEAAVEEGAQTRGLVVEEVVVGAQGEGVLVEVGALLEEVVVQSP